MIEFNADGSIGDQQVRVWLGQHEGRFTIGSVTRSSYEAGIESSKNFIRWLTTSVPLHLIPMIGFSELAGDQSDPLAYRLYQAEFGRGVSIQLWVSTERQTQAEVEAKSFFTKWLSPTMHVNTVNDELRLLTPAGALAELAGAAGFTDPADLARVAPLLKAFTRLGDDERRYLLKGC